MLKHPFQLLYRHVSDGNNMITDFSVYGNWHEPNNSKWFRRQSRNEQLYHCLTSGCFGSECVEWWGAKSADGYGISGVGSRVHRLSLEFRLQRKIKPGYLACHTCDNPKCFNPLHLYEDTTQNNTKHCTIKGRRVKGSQLPQSKLNENDVTTIKRMLNEGQSQKEIANLYGVKPTTISCIKIGKNWKHIK